MSPEISLVLRILSSLLLLGILAAIFFIIWGEYQRAAANLSDVRRNYGYLVEMREIEGRLLKTGRQYPLLPITSLGRSPTNSILIDDNFASSEHALITLRNGQWWLEDRRSRNGTLLNDNPVIQPMVITEGDVIGIGNLKFSLELES